MPNLYKWFFLGLGIAIGILVSVNICWLLLGAGVSAFLSALVAFTLEGLFSLSGYLLGCYLSPRNPSYQQLLVPENNDQTTRTVEKITEEKYLTRFLNHISNVWSSLLHFLEAAFSNDDGNRRKECADYLSANQYLKTRLPEVEKWVTTLENKTEAENAILNGSIGKNLVDQSVFNNTLNCNDSYRPNTSQFRSLLKNLTREELENKLSEAKSNYGELTKSMRALNERASNATNGRVLLVEEAVADNNEIKLRISNLVS